MRAALLVLSALLMGLALWIDASDALGLPRQDRARMGRIQRFAGPLGTVAASAEWMRFSLATRSGDGEQALALGRSALGMDPLAPDGWQLLAHHMIFERGSNAENHERRGRRRWIEAGMDLLEEGTELCRRPSVLLYDEGLVARYFASLPEADLPWDGCRAELLERARGCFERALLAGHRAAERALADTLAEIEALENRAGPESRANGRAGADAPAK